MLLKFASLVALAATLVVASVTPTVTIGARDDSPSLNPPPEAIKARSQARELRVPQLTARQLTNAKRLAAGLPLNPPKRRSRVARSVPSGTPILARGYLRMDAEDGSHVGFVRNTFNSFGEFGGTSDPASYLIVEVDVTNGSSDISTTNAPNADLPFFGGIVGFASTSDNLGTSNANYAYLGGTTQTPPGSPPQAGSNTFTAVTSIPESIESAIWKYDPSTQTVSPQWINTDSSSPATYIGYTQDIILLTSDKTAFANTFGPTQFLHLTFVPI